MDVAQAPRCVQLSAGTTRLVDDVGGLRPTEPLVLFIPVGGANPEPPRPPEGGRAQSALGHRGTRSFPSSVLPTRPPRGNHKAQDCREHGGLQKVPGRIILPFDYHGA